MLIEEYKKQVVTHITGVTRLTLLRVQAVVMLIVGGLNVSINEQTRPKIGKRQTKVCRKYTRQPRVRDFNGPERGFPDKSPGFVG
jgi:hypothetical protein